MSMFGSRSARSPTSSRFPSSRSARQPSLAVRAGGIRRVSAHPGPDPPPGHHHRQLLAFALKQPASRVRLGDLWQVQRNRIHADRSVTGSVTIGDGTKALRKSPMTALGRTMRAGTQEPLALHLEWPRRDRGPAPEPEHQSSRGLTLRRRQHVGELGDVSVEAHHV